MGYEYFRDDYLSTQKYYDPLVIFCQWEISIFSKFAIYPKSASFLYLVAIRSNAYDSSMMYETVDFTSYE
jgi:hypothetical protein